MDHVTNNIRRLNDKERKELVNQFTQGIPFDALFPFTVNETVTIHEIDGYCAQCQQPIPHRQIRGERIAYPNGVVEIRALGLCCQTFTPFLFRFSPDGDLISRVGYKWRRFSMRRHHPAWWDLIGWARYITWRIKS